jgi:hypothetical protein
MINLFHYSKANQQARVVIEKVMIIGFFFIILSGAVVHIATSAVVLNRVVTFTLSFTVFLSILLPIVIYRDLWKLKSENIKSRARLNEKGILKPEPMNSHKKYHLHVVPEFTNTIEYETDQF